MKFDVLGADLQVQVRGSLSVSLRTKDGDADVQSTRGSGNCETKACATISFSLEERNKIAQGLCRGVSWTQGVAVAVVA